MIKWVNWGIGNTIGNDIYLNHHLAKHPKLRSKVIRHEMEHIKGNHDVDYNERLNLDLIKFVLRYPSSWLHFMPVMIIEGCIVYNIAAFYYWLMLICGMIIGGVLFYII